MKREVREEVGQKFSQAEGNIKIFWGINCSEIWDVIKFSVPALIFPRESTGMACKLLICIVHVTLYYIHVSYILNVNTHCNTHLQSKIFYFVDILKQQIVMIQMIQ